MLPWSILVVSRAVDLILVLLVEELHADNGKDEENDEKEDNSGEEIKEEKKDHMFCTQVTRELRRI